MTLTPHSWHTWVFHKGTWEDFFTTNNPQNKTVIFSGHSLEIFTFLATEYIGEVFRTTTGTIQVNIGHWLLITLKKLATLNRILWQFFLLFPSIKISPLHLPKI